ncbi:Ser/Thr phosphatase family protein, partial [Cooperia oncophora]
MLVNTINVSSWLILNALVPKALPDDVIKRYEAQFVKWPEISAQTTKTVLTHSLKTLRSFISSLLEAQFTSTHVQPLVELCMTVRLKFISDVIDSGVESRLLCYIFAPFGMKENWKQDFSSSIAAKTALPDFYENEVFDCLSAVRDALSTSGYPNEACLFSRERFRSTLVDIFVHLVTAIRHCFDRLLNLRGDQKKPQDLDLSRKDEEKSHLTTKKLLISICNLEFILETALKNISRRMLDCGVKYADEVYEKSKAKLSTYRKTLVKCYIMIKSSAFTTLIDSANYEFIPDDDVSDYAKEMMMCCVLQQAELELCAPQLTSQCLQATVQAAFDNLLDHLEAREPASQREATQRVIDICALEQALGGFTNLETRTHVNAYRAGLVAQLDQSHVRNRSVLARGLSLVNSGEGHEVGNRQRFAAVLKMEVFLLLCNFFLYNQLMVYFDKEDREKYDKRYVTKDRSRASNVLITFMVASQMVYFLYFAPSAFQGILFDICAILSGVWVNLLGIVAGFFIINTVMYVLEAFPSTRFIVAKVENMAYIGPLVLDRRYQIKVVLTVTLVMSLLMWLGSDKIVVKHGFTGSNGSFKIALVSDIHAGASVHRDQVSKVVDKLLDLHADAVALVGDMVDGSLRSLEDRMVPLWMLLYRYRTYFVSGNHEYYYGNAMEWFREYDRRGIHVLNNKCDMFHGICIVGVSDISSGKSGIPNHSMNLTEAMKNCSEGSSRIVLSHNPASVKSFSSEDLEKVDVVLSGWLLLNSYIYVSGHTHAGQYYVLLPIIPWILPYFHGLYDIGHGKLFVSAGTLYQ